MSLDTLELNGRASEWTNKKVAGALIQVYARTPCDEWDVRTLLNHMRETQRYFRSHGRGHDASPPAPMPSDLLRTTRR